MGSTFNLSAFGYLLRFRSEKPQRVVVLYVSLGTVQISVSRFLWIDEDNLCWTSVSSICKVGSQVQLLATAYSEFLFWHLIIFCGRKNSGTTVSKKYATLPKRDCPSVSGAPAWEKLELHISHRCSIPEETQLLWKPYSTFCSHPSPWQWLQWAGHGVSSAWKRLQSLFSHSGTILDI